MRINDWSSDVCSSDLGARRAAARLSRNGFGARRRRARHYRQLLGRRGERARVARSSRARADPRRGSRALVSQLPGIRDAGDARLCVAARVSAKTTLRGADRKFILLFMVMLTIAAGNTALQSVLPALGRSLGVADHHAAAAFSASALLWVIAAPFWAKRRSEEHTSELQSLMRISYAVFCLKKKKKNEKQREYIH